MRKEEILLFYKNYKLYIFPFLIAFSSLILIIFVILPQTIKLLSNQTAKDEIVKKSKFLEVKAQTLENYDASDLSLKVNYALNAYPVDRDFVTAIGLLQDLTVQNGFSVIGIILGGAPENKSAEQSYIIKADITGSLLQLPKLLSSIENSPRLMRINSVDAASSTNSQSVPISISVNVLYAVAPENFGDVDSPLPELSSKDQDILSKLARISPQVTTTAFTAPSATGQQVSTQLSPKGKSNPFE